MKQYKHNPAARKWMALKAGTALMAVALVAQAAVATSQPGVTGSSVGFFHAVADRAVTVYSNAQTFVNVLRLVHGGSATSQESSQPSSSGELIRCSGDAQKAPAQARQQS